MTSVVATVDLSQLDASAMPEIADQIVDAWAQALVVHVRGLDPAVADLAFFDRLLPSLGTPHHLAEDVRVGGRDNQRTNQRWRRSAHPDWEPKHIVKLAEPGFDQAEFDPERLRQRLQGYRASLDAPRIDVIQWMVRADLKDQDKRLSILTTHAERIGDCFGRLRDEGAIRSVVVFPYAIEDVEVCATYDWCDGCAVDLSAVEPEWMPSLATMAEHGKGVVAIRPFGNGRAIPLVQDRMNEPGPIAEGHWATPGEACVAIPLLHPSVCTVVGTASSVEHLRAAHVASATRPDLDHFSRVFGDLRARSTP